MSAYGYSRYHRSNAKQVNLHVSTTGGSRLPMLYELLARNTADNQTPMAHMQQLKTLMVEIGYPPTTIGVNSDW